MKTSADRLRDQAACSTLTRVRADRELVSDLLKPVFDIIETRLFDRTLNAADLCQNCARSQTVVEAQPRSSLMARSFLKAPSHMSCSCHSPRLAGPARHR